MGDPRGTREDPIPRQAARVVLLDPDFRVLLLRGFDPARPQSRFWFTVGGGLDDGESLVGAAVRELFEETGFAVAPEVVSGPLWQDVTDFPFEGRWYRQEQTFFAVRLSPDVGSEVSLAGLTPVEHASIDAHRWWTVGELESTAECFYPRDLATRLRAILEG